MLFFASDVIVLPYRVIFQSGVLLMAMSHGLPVIASDLAPNKEIITHKKNGYLADPNLNSLLNGINWLMKLNNKEINKIKKNNRQKTLKNFSLSTMVNKYEKLYHSLSS